MSLASGDRAMLEETFFLWSVAKVGGAECLDNVSENALRGFSSELCNYVAWRIEQGPTDIIASDVLCEISSLTNSDVRMLYGAYIPYHCTFLPVIDGIKCES